ncbi:MAG: NifU N-terminal domain-containing protein [Leptospiraceae bacterium]|nr:NifU N-terminal domain-containing protein [Leptospiraceae bacterium]
MSLFHKLISIFKVKKPISVNESPLSFSESAIQKILSHLEKRPTNIKSAFKVSIQYQAEKILCQVGFDDYKMIRKTLFDYPVPLIIAEQDELFLRGSYIDYHEEDEAYFYYPNIHLEVSDRSNSIFIFYIDRYIISKDSPIQFYAIDKENFNNSLPLLLKAIGDTDSVQSLYIEKNFISIEKSKEVDNTFFEEQMTDIILSYFEKCGYPLYITDFEITSKIPK